MLLLRPLWSLMGGSPHLEPQEGFSFGRPSEPDLEPQEGFPVLLLSTIWNLTGGSPHLDSGRPVSPQSHFGAP